MNHWDIIVRLFQDSIVVYGEDGTVLFAQYYNYGCLIQFVAGNGYELVDDEEFVDAPILQ